MWLATRPVRHGVDRGGGIGDRLLGGGAIHRVHRSYHATRAAPVRAPLRLLRRGSLRRCHGGEVLRPPLPPRGLQLLVASIMRMIGSASSLVFWLSALPICSTDWPGFLAT